jgi:hypothetical protein
MLRQGNVKLIGEPFPELILNPAVHPGGPTGQAGPGGAPPAGPIAQPGPPGALGAQLLDPTAQFARIYGFSFEGHYYDLARPVLMLVHGPGIPIPLIPPPPPSMLDSDQAVREWEFSGGLFQWNYDKMTMSIRLDIESGSLEQILLEAALTGTSGSYAGANVGIAGANVRGANVRGANVRGANVFGANVWGRNRGGDQG